MKKDMNNQKNTKKKSFSSDDFNWCIQNDFQVYLVCLNHTGKGPHRVAVRRRGISCEGKYKHVFEDGTEITSTETLSKETFKNQKDATNYMYELYGILRRTYG